MIPLGQSRVTWIPKINPKTAKIGDVKVFAQVVLEFLDEDGGLGSEHRVVDIDQNM